MKVLIVGGRAESSGIGELTMQQLTGKFPGESHEIKYVRSTSQARKVLADWSEEDMCIIVNLRDVRANSVLFVAEVMVNHPDISISIL